VNGKRLELLQHGSLLNKMAKNLDDVVDFTGITNVNGAIKMLTLAVTEIARLENERHRIGGHSAQLIATLTEEKNNAIQRQLIFYKDSRAVCSRYHGLDCSGFDSALRYLLPAYLSKILDE